LPKARLVRRPPQQCLPLASRPFRSHCGLLAAARMRGFPAESERTAARSESIGS
jgi:hypothetical protein